jgi:outer membrane protein with beta-barrel domain
VGSKVGGGAAALAVAILLSVSRLPAQTAEFSLGGGVSVPLGTFDDLVKVGWQGTAAVTLTSRRSPLGIQVDGSFSRFADETPLDIKSQQVYGTVNAVYRFHTSEDAPYRPYLIGGGGVYNSKTTGSDAPEGSSTKFGINVGAGFDFSLGGAALFVETRFHDIFRKGPNFKFLPITVGIRFGRG